MYRGLRLLALGLFMASLLSPLANAKPVIAIQDHDDHDRDHRVYDREHKDYHNWDANEDHAYRDWLNSRHESYHEFSNLKARDQQAYWNWRHSHEDHDHH